MVTTGNSSQDAADPSVSYRFTAEHKPTFVHLRGSGTNSEEHLRRFLDDAIEAAVLSRHDAILLELNFAGSSLNFGGLYSIVCERVPDAARFRRIAFVDVNPQHQFDRAEFVELAANKLGMNVRRFQRVVDAERWLQGIPGESTP